MANPARDIDAFGDDAARLLAKVLAAYARGDHGADVSFALQAVCHEAHALGMHSQAFLQTLRDVWSAVPKPTEVSDVAWSYAHASAVSECLFAYYPAEPEFQLG
jgi:hypothetical protein